MTNYTIRKVATVQGLYDVNEEAVYSDLEMYPGTIIGDIIARTALASPIVSNILRVMQEQSIVKAANSLNGLIIYYWRMIDWVELVVSNRAAARTWLETNDGNTVADMAVALIIPEPVAEALAEFLEREYSAALTQQ